MLSPHWFITLVTRVKAEAELVAERNRLLAVILSFVILSDLQALRSVRPS